MTSAVSRLATATVILACGPVAGSGIAGARSIGERLHEQQPTSHAMSGAAGGQQQGTIHVTDEQSWIRGYDWAGYEEQPLRCLSCDKDVSFPTEQKRHDTHKIAAPDRPTGE